MRPQTFEQDILTVAEETAKPAWSREAEERLKRVPFFVRNMVRGAVERFAVERGLPEITPTLMDEVKQKAMGGRFGGHGR